MEREWGIGLLWCWCGFFGAAMNPWNCAQLFNSFKAVVCCAMKSLSYESSVWSIVKLRFSMEYHFPLPRTLCRCFAIVNNQLMKCNRDLMPTLNKVLCTYKEDPCQAEGSSYSRLRQRRDEAFFGALRMVNESNKNFACPVCQSSSIGDSVCFRWMRNVFLFFVYWYKCK